MADNEKSPMGRILDLSTSNQAEFAEGVNLIKADDEGKVFEEQSVRDDRQKTTGCTVDFSGTEPRIIVSGRRKVKLIKLDEENEAGIALAEALSKSTGHIILAERKEKEDSKVPDIWLDDTTLGTRIQVQIRHFDEVAIRELGKTHNFELEVTIPAIADTICAAITDKNQIDAQLAAVTYLLLISPYPLPPVVHPAIYAEVALRNPERKYVQTWVASRREPAFRVQG